MNFEIFKLIKAINGDPSFLLDGNFKDFLVTAFQELEQFQILEIGILDKEARYDGWMIHLYNGHDNPTWTLQDNETIASILNHQTLTDDYMIEIELATNPKNLKYWDMVAIHNSSSGVPNGHYTFRLKL